MRILNTFISPLSTIVLILDGNSEIGAHEELSLLSDLLKAFDKIESSHKSHIFYPKGPIFLHACATCSQLPSNLSTIIVYEH